MSSYDPGHIQLTEEQLQCSTMISAPPLHIEIFNFHNQKHKNKIIRKENRSLIIINDNNKPLTNDCVLMIFTYKIDIDEMLKVT